MVYEATSSAIGERCHPEKVGETGLNRGVSAETSLKQAAQLRCHLYTEAEGVGKYA